MLRTFKITYQSMKDGHIGGHPVDNSPWAWIKFLLWVPIGFVCYVVSMGIFWVVYILFFLPVMLVAVYVFDRKKAEFGEQGIQFSKAYGRCTIPWSEVQEVIYRREPAATCYRVTRIPLNGKPREYTIASVPDKARFEETLQERGIPFRRLNWMNEEIGPDDRRIAPDSADASSTGPTGP